MQHPARALALAAILVAAPFAAATPAGAADKVRFQTDWLPSGEHAMYYGGWQKGIFAEEGIDITITRGYGSGVTVTKLAGGAFDFGVADIAAVTTARARQNVPVKTIAVLYTQSPHSLFVLKSSGITNFKGLEGKKISITPGNSHKFYFPKVAEKSGTDPNKIIWVNMDGAAMAGQIIASDETIAQRPDLTRRFLKAVKRSFDWARDNPEEACKMHIQKVPEVALDDCVHSVQAVMTFVYTDHEQKYGWGKESPERLAFTWQTIAESQDLDPKWDPKQAFDTSLVPAE